MNNECVIGIDIGGTNIRIGRTDENDQLVDFKRVSSKETFKDGNISESLTEVLKNYLDKYCKNVQVGRRTWSHSNDRWNKSMWLWKPWLLRVLCVRLEVG